MGAEQGLSERAQLVLSRVQGRVAEATSSLLRDGPTMSWEQGQRLQEFLARLVLEAAAGRYESPELASSTLQELELLGELPPAAAPHLRPRCSRCGGHYASRAGMLCRSCLFGAAVASVGDKLSRASSGA